MVQIEEEENFGPLLVNELEKHGITSADCKKLQVTSLYKYIIKYKCDKFGYSFQEKLEVIHLILVLTNEIAD